MKSELVHGLGLLRELVLQGGLLLRLERDLRLVLFDDLRLQSINSNTSELKQSTIQIDSIPFQP